MELEELKHQTIRLQEMLEALQPLIVCLQRVVLEEILTILVEVEEVQVERLVVVIRHNRFLAEMVIVPVVATQVVMNALVAVVEVLAQLVQMLVPVVVVMVVLVRHVLSFLDLHLLEQCHQIGYQL